MPSFPKTARLRLRRDYQRLGRFHHKYVGSFILVEYRYENSSRPRLGVTVTRKYGKANIRNRFKRVVREAFRHCQSDLHAGLLCNVRPRTAAYQASSKDIEADLRNLPRYTAGR